MLGFIFILRELPPTEHTAWAAFQRHNRLAPIIASYSSCQGKRQPNSLMCSKLLWAVQMVQRSPGNLPVLPSCSRASPCCSHPPGRRDVSPRGGSLGTDRDQTQLPYHNSLPVIRASLYCSTCFVGPKDQGPATGCLTVLCCSGTSLASAQDRTQPLVSLKLPPFLTSVKQSKKIKLILI